MYEGTVAILIPFGAFAMVVLLVWLGHQADQYSIHERSELRKQLLTKFGSAQELTEFLATPQGQTFLIEKDKETNRGASKNKQRIIVLMIIGMVLTVFGVGLLGLTYYERGFVYAGVMVLALGVGFLASSLVSFQLYKKWGLFN